MIRSKVKVLSAGHFLHCKSMGIFFVTWGRVTPKWIIRSGPKSLIPDVMAVLVTSKNDEDPIENEDAILRTRSNMGFFGTKGQVTPNRMVQSRPNSNFAEILCLSWLPASLLKIRSKMKTLSFDNIFPITSLWKILIAIETRVLSWSAPNPFAAFPHPNDASYRIWSRLANWPQRYSFESVDDDDRRTADHCYTISSPCEPSALVSWKSDFLFLICFKNCNNSARFNASANTTEIIIFLIHFTSIWWRSAMLTGYMKVKVSYLMRVVDESPKPILSRAHGRCFTSPAFSLGSYCWKQYQIK